MWKVAPQRSITFTARGNTSPLCLLACPWTLSHTRPWLLSMSAVRAGGSNTNWLAFPTGLSSAGFPGISNPVTLNLFGAYQLFRQTMVTYLLTSPSLPNTNLGGLNLWWLGSPFSSSYDLFLRGHSYHVTPFHSYILREWWLAGSSCGGHMRGFTRFLFDDYLATNMIMILNKHPMKKATNIWIFCLQELIN